MDLKESVFIAINTSLVASIVFWICFEMIPQKIKYRKMRPVVEQNLYWIEFYLLMYLQCVFLYSRYTATNYQNKISEGVLSEEDYKVFLNTKCLNESYHFDEWSAELLVVGDKLQQFTDEMLQRIEHAYRYTDYTRVEEYNLLEEISKRITMYVYNDNATTIINNKVIRPVNPSICYMYKSFKELNDLLIILKEN